MKSTTSHTTRSNGALAGLVRRAAGASARHPRRTIALWFVLVAGLLAAGSMTGTQQLEGSEYGTGESQRADRQVEAAGLHGRAVESVLIRSSSAQDTSKAAADVERRLSNVKEVGAITGPADTPDLSTAGGRTVLVQVQLRGDPDDAADRVDPVQHAVAAAARANPEAKILETGQASAEKEMNKTVTEDLQRAELFSIPLTLLILVLAFGALVAAAVPLLLGVTSVAAALGALGIVSQLTPTDDATATVIVLIGLAVGVDYSLFYIRREREERRRGNSQDAALDVAAATVGRAILVSGLTVMVALAGLLFTGLSVFSSMALATMVVVVIAVIGSLTVLPAVLARLGGKVDKGRVPGLARLSERREGRPGLWGRLAGAATRRPKAALIISLSLLASMTVPAIDMQTAAPDASDLPKDSKVIVALNAVERSFPGSPDDADLVVTGPGLDKKQRELGELGKRAREATGGKGVIDVRVARDGRTAVVSVPMPDRGVDDQKETVEKLREDVAPTAAKIGPGTHALVTGDAAGNADFTHQLSKATPLVIAFVLSLAFVLMLAAFRSPALAASVMGLNLLSVGAAYGVLVAVFQHSWAEDLLGFTSSGTITDWLPLFLFVILFGLSMDYTVLVLERIREARRDGKSAAEAAAEGVTATAGTVTSAAIVMVGVFAIFATLSLLQFKQFGIGLAAAILIDATIVRGIALPAVVAALGERRWKVRPARQARTRELDAEPLAA